jgi:hypothetical protein
MMPPLPPASTLPTSSTPPRGISILISGSGESAMSMLALAFARQVDPAFAWANLSPSTSGFEGDVRRLLVDRSEGHVVEQVALDDLATRSARPDGLDRLLMLGPVYEDLVGRFTDYLQLPGLLQTLVCRTLSPNGGGAILLTNVDAVSPPTAVRALELPHVHETLHREGVTLLATYRGTAPDRLAQAFNEVFRVEQHIGMSWPEALLAAERGGLLPGLLAPRPLRECWSALGLCARLLPP